jgi:hypothetical protein
LSTIALGKLTSSLSSCSILESLLCLSTIALRLLPIDLVPIAVVVLAPGSVGVFPVNVSIIAGINAVTALDRAPVGATCTNSRAGR